MAVVSRGASQDYLNAWMREEVSGADAGTGTVLDGAHAPTARLVQQLRRARLKLHRAASPDLQLSPAIRALWRTELRLDRPLRIAVCGEINAGKSSLANLLAGIDSLPTAVISNTRIPTLLYHAAEPEIWTVQANGRRERVHHDRAIPRRAIFRVEVGLPSPRLRALQIVDLPGLADAGPKDTSLDLAAHHVDAAIWCTMSTQAWKESERIAWDMLPQRLRIRGILVATHRDLLQDADDRRKLLGRLRHAAGTSFTSIILLSTLDAIAVMGKERSGMSGVAWIASGAEALETALGSLLFGVREQRAAAALRITSRVAERALIRIDNQVEPTFEHVQ